MKKVLAAFSFLSLAVLVTMESQWGGFRAEKVTEAWQQINGKDFTSSRSIASQEHRKGHGLQNEIMRRLNLERREASLPGGKWEAQHRLSLSELFANYRLVVEPQNSGRLIIKELEWIKPSEEVVTGGIQVTDFKSFFAVNADLFGLQYVDVGQLKNLEDGAFECPGTNWQGQKVRVQLRKNSKDRLLRLSFLQD